MFSEDDFERIASEAAEGFISVDIHYYVSVAEALTVRVSEIK